MCCAKRSVVCCVMGSLFGLLLIVFHCVVVQCRGTGAKDGDTKKCKSCNGQGVKVCSPVSVSVSAFLAFSVGSLMCTCFGLQMTIQQLGPGFNVQMQQTCEVCV